MSFTNINDPAGVKALLDRLRSSEQWQDAVAASAAPAKAPAPAAAPAEPEPAAAAAPASSDRISALLSQLHAPAPTPAQPRAAHAAPALAPAPARRQDMRHLTFQQALPHLARLADAPAVRAALDAMRREQAELERSLLAERNALLRAQAERVGVARTKAKIAGGGLAPRAAAALAQAFQKEVDVFDGERVLVAWDGLIAKQQGALEALGVPAMFVSDVQTDRDRQQRVIQVLEGIIAGDDV